MNLIDVGIICVFVLFVLIGWHNGFFVSTLNLACFFLAWLFAVLLSPAVSNAILSNEGLADAMLYYTEGAELVEDVEMRRLPVNQLSSNTLSEILEDANLPSPLDTLVAQNMAGEVFAEDDITTVGDYFNQTIVNFTVNVLAFLIVFLLVRIVLAFVVHGVDYTIKLPMLQHFDAPLGAGFGLVRGFFALFVVFMVLPTFIVLIEPAFPSIRAYIDDSFLGPFFYNSNFLLSFVRGVV